MAWGDALAGLLGRPDPYEELRQYQAAQAAKNAAALQPPGPNAPAGGPPGGPQNATSAAISQGTSQQPQPNAVQTPKDLGSILVDLTQQEQMNQGLNQSLGMGFAAFAQPRDRQMVSQMFNVNQPDPNKLGETLMTLNSQQQGQDRANAIMKMVNSPAGQTLAAQNNMTVEQLRAMAVSDPGSVARLISTSATPTDTMKNIQQITAFGQAHGWSPTDIANAQHLISTGMMPGDVQAMQTAALAWQQNHPGKPLPWDNNSPNSYKQYVANQAEINDTASKAAVVHGNNIGMVTEMNNRIQAINNSPALDSILNSVGAKKQAAVMLLKAPLTDPTSMLIKSLPAGVSFNSQELAVIDNIRQLGGQQYATALHALGLTRPSEREIEGINSGLGQISNLDLDPATYRSQALQPMDDLVKTMRANSFGASQNFNDMPKDLRTYVDPQFLAGGTRNLDGSGSEPWAAGTKMSQDEQDAAGKLLTSGKINPKTGAPWTRYDVDQLIRSEGKRPMGY